MVKILCTRSAGIWLLGLPSAVLYGANFSAVEFLSRLGVFSSHPPPFASLAIPLLPLSLFYLLSLRLIRHAEPKEERPFLFAVLFFALLFRLPLVVQEPLLSSDLYRYLWDGRVQAVGGLNPYLYAVEDGRLAFLRDEAIYPHINRKAAPTIYPAGAQLLFRGMSRAGLDNPAEFKAAILAAELLTVVFLLLILKALQLPLSRILIYAWNPLIVYELFHSGHLEGFLIPPVLGFLYLFLRGSPIPAGALLGLAAAIKLVPGFFLVALPPGKRLKVALALLVTLGAAYLFYADAGGKILGFLPVYFSDPHEIFNPGFIQAALFWAAKFFSLPTFWARYVLLLMFSFLLVWIAGTRRAGREDTIRKIYLCLSAYLFLIYPALHPWYLAPLIPFLCFFPSPAWIYLSLALPLSYLKYAAPDGVMPAWVTWAQFAPLYTLLALEWAERQTVAERRSPWRPAFQRPSSIS